MQRTHVLALIVVCACIIGRAAHGQSVVPSVQEDGVVTWTNVEFSSSVFCIEWAIDPNGPWYSTWSPMTKLRMNGPTHSVGIPMFYRVVRKLPAAIMSRTYTVVQFATDPDPYTACIAMAFDGVGRFDWTETTNSNVGGGARGTLDYTVSSDGILSGPPGEMGVVSHDGSIFLLSGTSGNEFVTFLGVEQSTEMSGKSLLGQYVVSQFATDPQPYAARFIMDFAGEGEFSWMETVNSMVGGGAAGQMTYTVASNGTLSISSGDSGIVSHDGSVMVLVDTDGSDNGIGILVGIRQTAGRSTADLTGRYVVNQLAADPQMYMVRFLMDFDGAGTVVWTEATDSIAGGGAAGRMTYAVAPDGTLSGFNGETGIVSTDGSVFVLLDANAFDGGISMFVGVRTW